MASLEDWLTRENFEWISEFTLARKSHYFVSPNFIGTRPLFQVQTYNDMETVDLFFSDLGKRGRPIEVWMREIPIAELQRVARGYENRLADAWNDLNS